eukprot:2283131-Pyramimonas_sp.AAC.1
MECHRSIACVGSKCSISAVRQQRFSSASAELQQHFMAPKAAAANQAAEIARPEQRIVDLKAGHGRVEREERCVGE